MSLTPNTVTNPSYSDSVHNQITAMVTWVEMPNEPPMPFTATPYDPEPYGVALYNDLQAGVYGSIGQFIYLSVSPSIATPAVVDTQYSQILTSPNAIGSYTITQLDQLPNGLNIQNNAIIGTPTVAGTYNFSVSISDSNNNIGNPRINLVVS